MILPLPNPNAEKAANAARLAPFACAAYDCDESIKLIDEAITAKGGTWERFEVLHCHGIVAQTDSMVIIAIAGTDDRDDWRSNMDFSAYRLRTFARHKDVMVSVKNERVLVHSGFLQVAYLVYDEIKRLDVGQRDVWVVGHSLGGAAACLLPVMWPAIWPHVVTFGAPRVVHRDSPRGLSDQSYASFHRWVSIDDLIPQFPVLCYRHPQIAELMYLRAEGDCRGELPWIDTVWRAVRRVWNCLTKGVINTTTAAHSCRRYCKWLEVLR